MTLFIIGLFITALSLIVIGRVIVLGTTLVPWYLVDKIRDEMRIGTVIAAILMVIGFFCIAYGGTSIQVTT